MQTRLPTILGAGGAGKTGLAIQVATDMIDDFSNGVFISEFAPLTDPSFVLQTIMNSLRVKEEPGKSLEETLENYLKDKELLLILDNCEHLINECANLTEMLLSNCPKLKIFATSREALNCSGEQTYRVPSLSLPRTTQNNSSEELTQYESVRLFIERALTINPNFRVNNNNAPALAEICNRLDGIPLAIELAAARIKVLSVEKIYERLDDRFNLLTAGKRTSLPRQQTLRALIDWSYDLLSEREKMLWRKLSVFKGGWTLEAAEGICSDEKITKGEILDLLSQLSEKSIIIYNEVIERYSILETIKQYGEEKLKDANEAEDVLSKHLHVYMEFSEKVEPKLDGSEMHVWLEKLEEDHGNFQSAIEWSIRARDIEKGARLAGALGSFWDIRGHYSTGRQLLDSILDNAQGVSKPALGKVLYCTGMLTMFLGEYERAQKFFEESLHLRREMEDKSGIADSLNNLGSVAYFQGNYEQAQKFYEQSLTTFREIGDKHGIAVSLSNLGIVSYIQGNYEQAKKFYEESLVLHRELGNKLGIAASLSNLGNIVLIWENYEQAQKFLEESQALNREIGNKHGIAGSLINLGNIAFNLRNYEQAQKFYEECLTLSRETGDKRSIANSLNHLGNVAYYQGNYEQSQKFYEESLSIRRDIGENSGIAKTIIGFTAILIVRNHLTQAVMLLGYVKSTGLILHRIEQRLHQQILDELHEKLSDEEFGKYFEEGKKLTLEEASQLIVCS